ncbi:response regulator transcription factor [Streptomyces sp. NPDC059909]|uniref:helix-turn-helix transcriptional regulator n=1 Tax=Streptomyces sp. NPDC059909 TaxID=3346998 RepID=UPI00365A4473
MAVKWHASDPALPAVGPLSGPASGGSSMDISSPCPTGPDARFEPRWALVRARTNALDRVRSHAGELSRLFAAAQRPPPAKWRSSAATSPLGRWFVRLQHEASEEVVTLDRPPYALSTSRSIQSTALRRGVRYRTVYAPESLQWPGVLNDIRELAELGEDARVLDGLRVKLAIADRRLAIMPLSLDLGDDVRAAVVRPSALLDALIDLTEALWGQALPIGAPAADLLSPEDRAALTLMCSGMKDEAIARQLGWSIRTMRRRVQVLYGQLGASNRFQAGVLAARRGWITE